MIAVLGLALCITQNTATPVESDYYTVDYLTPPADELIEVGGMDFLSDGRLVVSTRRGQVWIVENPGAEDPTAANWSLFAEGLWEGLGLAVVDDKIHVLQRQELSLLTDLDGDGICDEVATLADDWGVSGNYHEFAFGLPRDDAGNFYFSLNVSFFSPKWWHGKSPVPYRGWVMRIKPDGTVEPVASGLRSPCGIGFDAHGRLLVTDNQGDWFPSCPIVVIEEGKFYGHPASLAWTERYADGKVEPSDTIPPDVARAPAAIWLPYGWSRSTGNLVPDLTGGKFGPFDEQLFVAELTNGQLLRADLEDVHGVTQGACWLFRQQIGSAARVAFAPDGTLFVGMTNRGWGGLAPGHGVARVRWTGRTPMEMERVALEPGGFRVRFTLPLEDGVHVATKDVRLEHYDYDWWWEYGSPERDTRPLDVAGVTVSADRRELRVLVPGLEAGRVVRGTFSNVVGAGGEPLLHDTFAYTINVLAGGSGEVVPVAKLVPPPPARATGWEGWLRLTFGDATDIWNANGWELCEAELDPADSTRFATRAGNGALVGTGDAGDFTSRLALGDGSYHLEFMLPASGSGAIVLQGQYVVNLADTRRGGELSSSDCGGLAPSDTFAGAAPQRNAFHGPGLWHALDLDFRAARVDASGAVLEPARVLRLRIDDQLVHENVALGAETAAEGDGVAALGSLVLRPGSGLAVRELRFRPTTKRERPNEQDGWQRLLADEDELASWTRTGNAEWRIENNILIGEGPVGHLFSPRGDYGDFELRARVKVNEGGNSGLYFRATPKETWPAGYEAQVNSSHPDPQKTGSLYGLAPVKVHLVPSDTWFDYHVSVCDESGGARLRIAVNGVLVTEHLDADRRYTSGHFAIQQHHEGSVIEVRDVYLREPTPAGN